MMKRPNKALRTFLLTSCVAAAGLVLPVTGSHACLASSSLVDLCCQKYCSDQVNNCQHQARGNHAMEQDCQSRLSPCETACEIKCCNE